VIEAAQLLNEHPWMFVIVGQGGGKRGWKKWSANAA
jgi:colanic acid biosynthesis glycosyl transferase WcaI